MKRFVQGLMASVAVGLLPVHAGATDPAAGAAQPAADAPTVFIARSVIDAAGVFDGYLRAGVAVDPEFKNAAGVSAALTAAAGYEAGQLEDGVVAYAALLAMQDVGLVGGVAAAAPTPELRAALAERLIREPAAALELAGARAAGMQTASFMGQRSAALHARGKAVRQAAYTIQHQSWSLAKIGQPEVRLSQVKARGITRISLAPGDVERVIGGVVEHRPAAAAGDASGYAPTPALTRGLALAAVALLGHAGEDKAAALEPLLSDKASADCLRMAKLNLHQCLAVAGPQYEDVFCLGQHALADTGQCLVAAAGAPAPAMPVQTLVARATGVVIPIGYTRTLAATPAPPTTAPMSGGDEPAPAKPIEMSAVAPTS